jgi:hypothetical protein
MPADFPRGYFVSDENKKLPPLEPLSSLSASGLPASDRSLERVLGAIAKTIESFTSVAKMIHDEVTSQGKMNMARHEMAVKLLGKMRVELATLTDQLSTLEEAAQDMQDATGQHALQVAAEEGDAPKWSHRALNFVWPTAVRGGKAAALWGVKLLAGSTALGGLAKIIHDMIVGG